MNSLILAVRTSSIIVLVLLSMTLLSGCGGGDGAQITDLVPEKPATGQAGDGNLE
jgi:hypothetical protein